MIQKKRNPHKPFMVLNGILAFVVFVIACLFLYVSFQLKRDKDKEVTYEGKYLVEISKDFAGEDISVYLNDSLLMNGIIPDTLVTLDIDRFAEEHVLMIVDNLTDATTPYNLNKEGSKMVVKKSEGEIIFEETSAH